MTALASPIATPPALTEMAPGILRARLPLPFALNHINVWLLRDVTPAGQPGWAVVDTGVSSKMTRGLWQEILEGPLGGEPVTKVIVTHFHPDHIGLAQWFCDRFPAPLWMTQAEWLLARLLSLDVSDGSAQASREFYACMGLEPAMLVGLEERGHAYAHAVPGVPASYNRLRAGMTLRVGTRDWTIITSGGHSPEHACLFSESDKVLIAGDMVLPRISPNVSVFPAEPQADPLSDFLDGLARLRRLPADTLVLPSHGEPFSSLHERIDELTHHHRDRLQEALDACADQPHSIADITRMMFRRPLDVHQMVFAAGEALAHLNHLVRQGRMRRQRRDDGILMFSTVADES